MIYKYKAITQDGESIEGYFEGDSRSEVISMLKTNNYLPVEVEEDIGVEVELDLFSPKVKKKDLAVFCRQFYTMLDAGIDIINCIDILKKQSENKSLIKGLEALHEDVQKGLTLSEGMKNHDKVFPQLLVYMVEAGEVSGNLDTIMERMAVHYEKENKLENKIKSAMIYPIVLAVVSIVVVVFLLVGVMPTFIGMFESSGQELAAPTRILLAISDLLGDYWYIFLALVLAGGIGVNAYKETFSGRRLFDNLKIRLPVIKDTNIKIITARFTRTLSTLMSSGIPLLEAIDIVGRVVGNKVVEDKLEVAVDDISRGVTLSKTIKDTEIFPPMVDSMLKIGEESGAIDDILYKTADFYDEEVEVALDRMTSLMEPIMIVIMAVIIGFIVIAMALPMFDMVNTI